MNADQLIELSREQDLYFVAPKGHADEIERIIFLPQGWCDEFTVENGFAGGIDSEDAPDLYGYIGSPDILNWKMNERKEALTSDINGWTSIDDLLNMRQVSEQEARQIDADLFITLDAINDGTAV